MTELRVKRTITITSAPTRSNPDDDSQLSLSAEAGLPVAHGWLRFARLRGRVDKPLPIVGPVTLHLRGRGGAVRGDLPPYEAFPIGGTNSVRGYSGARGQGWVDDEVTRPNGGGVFGGGEARGGRVWGAWACLR